MPIYEYECEACGRRSEAIQRLAEAHLTECEECGGRVRRLISAPAVQFKGTGWYVTDYAKSKGPESSSSSESSTQSESSSKGSDSTKAGSNGAESKSGASSGPAD